MKSKTIKCIFAAALAVAVTGAAVLPAVVPMSSGLTVAAASYMAQSKYKINISLMQFDNDEYSMGNGSMKSPATLVTDINGNSHIEIEMQSMTYLGMDGYLGKLRRVTKILAENKYHYPTEIETEDAEVLEEFVDVYDMFNDPSSENADSSVVGKWYPKVLSMPVNTSEEEILVQVYVPVMESIMEGGGTKFARLVLDYSSLEKIEEPIEESSEPSEKSEVSEISEVSEQSEVSEISEISEQSEVSEISEVSEQSEVFEVSEVSEVFELSEISEPSETSEISVPTVPATLDRYNLADGEYVVDGHMIKIDRESSSMSEKSIDHKIKLTVKDRKINVTMNFKGITIGDKYGYLGKLYYFLTGYTENQYGRPQGEIAPAAINSYHLDENGNHLVDIYGTDYPNEVTFELIPEALESGWVPLQVFVPVMESISAGGGTQEVFLKLDWTTLVREEDAVAEESKEEFSKPAENSKLPIFNGGLNNKPLVPETDNNTSSVTAAVNNTVATGDSTSLAGILAAITVSLGAVFALSKKRKNDN